MSDIVFDIETGALPWDQLERIWQPPEKPGNFDERSVRLGNIKDPAKIREKIEAAKTRYVEEVANWQHTFEDAKAEFISRAALSPLTGQVLAVGLKTEAKEVIVGSDGETEGDILHAFWDIYKRRRASNGRMIGYNCAGFDVPFLVRRSWFCGVGVPESLYERGRYLCSTFVDLTLLWSQGTRDPFVKLDTLAKFFGIGGKPDDCDGGTFAALWRSDDPAIKQQAAAYLLNDLSMTWKLAEKMGVIQ